MMFLVNNPRFLLSLILSWAINYSIFYGKGIHVSLVGVLLYFGIFHFLVQYWYAKYMFIDGENKSSVSVVGVYIFCFLVIAIPLFVMISVFNIDYNGLNIYSLILMVLGFVFHLVSFSKVFEYFSSLDEGSKWGGEMVMKLYFSRYPPKNKSDSIGMDVLLFIVIVITFASIYSGT